LRGFEFEPLPFRFEIMGCPDILDAKGRAVELPTLRPASEQAAENRQHVEASANRAALRVLVEMPDASQQDFATAVGCSKSSVNRRLRSLGKERLVEHVLDKWTITEKRRRAILQ